MDEKIYTEDEYNEVERDRDEWKKKYEDLYTLVEDFQYDVKRL